MPPEHFYSSGRRKTRQVAAGDVLIGGGAPVSVQSMTKTKTSDIAATITQIKLCAEHGAHLMRVTINDKAAADAIGEIVRQSPLPIIADIHFNHTFALKAIDAGVAKVRINPGNIGKPEIIKQVLDKAKNKGIPIRIGVNSGSLEKGLIEKYGTPKAEALFESAMRHAELAEGYGFRDIVIAVKSTDVRLMIDAYRLLARQTDYPLHLGVTEAGTLRAGTIKSAVGIGALLAEGIGDTIRVSLTDSPEKEIEVGKDILRSLGLMKPGVEIISCPTCGRLESDLPGIVSKLETALGSIDRPLKIAVMGCLVNGPGEVAGCDIGVICGKDSAFLYIDGNKVKKMNESEIVEEVVKMVKEKCGIHDEK